MGKEVDILPPIRTVIEKPKPVSITAHVPTLYRGGPISAKIDAWVWNSQSKAIDALTRVNSSEAALASAQTSLAINKLKRDDALFALQEAPERRGHELAVRRVQRATELRAYQHRYEIQELGYMKEVKLSQAEYVHAKATYKRAEVDLVDAEQQLAAQIKHGALSYELAHAEQNLKRLDIQLGEHERRALMRKQLLEIEGPQDDAEQALRDRLAILSDEGTRED